MNALRRQTSNDSRHSHNSNNSNHGHHPKPTRSRSLSPFRGLAAKSKPNTSNVLLIHSSAHAIVFRDHLRLARKVIHEVVHEENDDDDDEDDDQKSVDSSSSSSTQDSEDGAAAFQGMSQPSSSSPHHHHGLHKSLRQSIRETLKATSFERPESEKHVVEQVNELAHSLVPEMEKVHLELDDMSERHVEIEGLHTHMTPLPELPWNERTEYTALLQDPQAQEPCDDWSAAEKEVFVQLVDQKACVKTIKNSEWPVFLERFTKPRKVRHAPTQHDDIPPKDGVPFNSFTTSTSLLPSRGLKMRAFGSEISYTVGVVFALPEMASLAEEDQAVRDHKQWAWPAGYAAKTEFNISHGELINGRKEALVSLEQLRQYNEEYLYKKDHFIAGRVVPGGFKIVPYNEVYLRVGGPSRIVECRDVVTSQKRVDTEGSGRSYANGTGLFVALFIRRLTCNDLIMLMRTRARIAHILGDQHVASIPLLYIHPDHGVRVFTKKLQHEFWHQAAHQVQPFLNPSLASTLKYHETNEASLQQKIQEQITWTEDMMEQLTAVECACLMGGFGATDASFSALLEKQHGNVEHLHDIMQAAWQAAIRSNDHFTARQVLALYVLDSGHREGSTKKTKMDTDACLYSNFAWLEKQVRKLVKLPAPLATKSLRRATNNDGILIVLGAAQILKSVVTGSAKRRTTESAEAVEEWVKLGEDSVAFRVSSWKDQRTEQADSHLAVSKDSKFMAFVGTKSVTNRRKFAEHLRQALHEFTCVRFLQCMYSIVKKMHSPCMRLELLEFILGLDTRYSIQLIQDSIELAATCLSIVNDL